MAVTSGLALAASILSAASSIKQGQEAKKQGRAQAEIYAEQATRERELAALSERDFRKRQSAALGEFRAASGTSGTESGTGSSLLVAEDFAAETELQALRIRKGGQINATRLEQQAGLTRRAGRSAQIQGFARGGASLLSGFGQYNELSRRSPSNQRVYDDVWEN
jgi:hypothetical protein